MKRLAKCLGAALFVACALAGCVNKQGLSSSFYSECGEYYDALGVYHTKCPNDILDLSN